MEFNVVNKNDTFTNPFTHSVMSMLLVSKIEEVNIRGVKFTNKHYYNVRATHKNHLYQWFEHPDYNMKSDYKKYRSIVGLMTPVEIKKLRYNKYHLTQSELATILGMSYPTISSIENGSHIQSVAQNNLLENLKSPLNMYRLTSHNLQRIEIVKPSRVNIKNLKIKMHHVKEMI